jgi:hypothetical protein
VTFTSWASAPEKDTYIYNSIAENLFMVVTWF